MAQIRTLVRGIAFTLDGAPAAALQAVDRALAVLAVDTLATAVIATLTRRDDGTVRLCWSNAGHPPPLLLDADGEVTFLETPADLLLGLDPRSPRHDHERDLPPGTTVVLFTDGLVERRNLPIDDGMARLAAILRRQHHLDADALAHLVVDVRGGRVEDDTALLVLRVPSA